MTSAFVHTFTDLRIGFDVDLSTDPEPNKASFTVVNLSKSTRDAVLSDYKAIKFSAGYGDEVSQIFLGNITDVRDKREPTGFVLEIDALDGHDELKAAHFDKSFSAGTPLQTIIAAVAASLGLPFELGFIPVNDSIIVGTTYSGTISKVMTDLCDQLSLKWSIQGGVLKVSDKNSTLISTVAQVVILAPDTGLIGSPVLSINEDPKEKDPIGSIDAVSLLNPLLLPDHPVMILPANPMTFAGVKLAKTKKIGAYDVTARGLYRIKRSRFTGSNKDGAFHTEITCPIFA